MKTINCSLCVKRLRVECNSEDWMQVQMSHHTCCSKTHVLQSNEDSMIPAIRFIQKHTEVPLAKLLQLIKDNPRESRGYAVYTDCLEAALEKEMAK